MTGQYAHYVDRGYNDLSVDAAGLATVFTEDVSWNYPAFGMGAAGKDAVIAMPTNPAGSPDVAMHSFTNPKISVDGDRATGIWLIWVAQRNDSGISEVFQSEDVIYERVDGRWLISSISLHFGALLQPAGTPAT